jgi:hypothetical protein
MLPREHGAWGLLLQPFVCAAILGGRWDWLYLPALGLVLAAFVIREPLLVVARQKWTWRAVRPESAVARSYAFAEAAIGAALFLICLRYLPAGPLLGLAGAAAIVTMFALWMAVWNRQRSLALQVVSSLGLASSGLLAALVAARELPAWSWLLCGVLALHGIASILVVRARLELRAGSKKPSLFRLAWLVQMGIAGVAIALAVWGRPALGAAVAFSAVASAFELARLRSRAALVEPLRRVGFRALGVSLAHGALTVAALW